MGRISKFAVVCALAVTAIVASTTAASASTGLRTASGTALTVTARGPTTLNVSGVNIICTVDLTIAVNQSINKTVGAAVGSASLGTISNCNGGYSGTIDNNIPITYLSFGGTLPITITSANGVATGALFTMTGGTVFGANRCQFRGNPTVALTGPGTSFSGGSFRGSVAYNAGPAACPRTGNITNAALALYGTLTSVAIALF